MNKMFITKLLIAFWLFAAATSAFAAQTCSANISSFTAPDSRYTDNSDGTVTDKRTGLMWKQCSEGLTTNASACDSGSAATFTWLEAMRQAQTVNSESFAGHEDWRMPNRNELASLVERRCQFPSINENLFPYIQDQENRYWSSSPRQFGSAETAKSIAFIFGNGQLSLKSLLYSVRLVRGGL